MYATKVKGPRYLQLTEGYVTRLALDEEDQIIGYEFVKTGPMMENIKKGMDANEEGHRQLRPLCRCRQVHRPASRIREEDGNNGTV